MKTSHLLVVSLGAIAAAGTAIPLFAARSPDSGPIARYDMRAGTSSGIGQMGQGGRPNMAALMGGGSQVQHELLLRLGSSHAAADGKPRADHFMPAVAKLGKSVELVTPKVERGPSDQLPSSGPGQRPTGRILIFWGCGEHAPKGQPVVIDLSKLGAGEVPPGLFTKTIPPDWGPNLENSKTFGRWPAEDGKSAQPGSSLLGDHKVVSNYAPEIDFTLHKDFMAPIALHSTRNPSASTSLSWNAVPDATGYYAYLFGGKQGPRGQMGDIVMWSSSATQQFGGALADWLSPSRVAPLVTDHTVMAPSTTSCIVPAEVGLAAPDFKIGTLTAYGPEEDFSYPPRPTDAKARWDLQWTARIRHRSTTSWMETQGMTMGTADASGFGADDSDDEDEDEAPQQKQCKPKRGLGGLLGGAVSGALGGNGC